MLSLTDTYALAEKFSLPPDEIRVFAATAIEQAVGEAMHMEVYLQPDGSIKASGRTIEKYELTPALERHAQFRLEAILQDASDQRRWESAIRLENTVVYGEAQYQGDRIIVHTTCGFVGHTTKDALPKREQGHYRLGGKKAFYVNHVSRVDKRTLILNRTSISLPELLIKNLAAEGGVICSVKCLKRIPGAYSVVRLSREIPQNIITAVQIELNEEIRVKSDYRRASY